MTDPKAALPYFRPPFPFEQVEIACALYDAIRKRAPNGEYVAVRIDGASGWTIVDPRSQEAMLAALETIEPKPSIASAAQAIADEYARQSLNREHEEWPNFNGLAAAALARGEAA